MKKLVLLCGLLVASVIAHVPHAADQRCYGYVSHTHTGAPAYHNLGPVNHCNCPCNHVDEGGYCRDCRHWGNPERRRAKAYDREGHVPPDYTGTFEALVHNGEMEK